MIIVESSEKCKNTINKFTYVVTELCSEIRFFNWF